MPEEAPLSLRLQEAFREDELNSFPTCELESLGNRSIAIQSEYSRSRAKAGTPLALHSTLPSGWCLAVPSQFSGAFRAAPRGLTSQGNTAAVAGALASEPASSQHPGGRAEPSSTTLCLLNAESLPEGGKERCFLSLSKSCGQRVP